MTATHIGTWAIDKLIRFSLLVRGGEPIVWDKPGAGGGSAQCGKVEELREHSPGRRGGGRRRFGSAR
jgi:hypothetical protein